MITPAAYHSKSSTFRPRAPQIALPGGPVGLALGGFFSRQTYEINPDDQANIIHPEELGTGGMQPVKAGRKEVAFYGEIRVPIFSPKMGIRGLHSLEFDAGARFEEFRNNDTNVLVPKVALRWQPSKEGGIRQTPPRPSCIFLSSRGVYSRRP